MAKNKSRNNAKLAFWGIVFTAGTTIIVALIQGWFSKSASAKEGPQKTITSTPKLDSGTQINNTFQIDQTADSGNHIEVVANKTVNNYPPSPIMQKNKPKKESVQKESTVIDNKGNLSMNQQGGTVNQNTYVNDRPQRHLIVEDIENIERFNAPKDIHVVVQHVSNDNETFILANEIATKLKEMGYNNLEVANYWPAQPDKSRLRVWFYTFPTTGKTMGIEIHSQF